MYCMMHVVFRTENLFINPLEYLKKQKNQMLRFFFTIHVKAALCIQHRQKYKFLIVLLATLSVLQTISSRYVS